LLEVIRLITLVTPYRGLTEFENNRAEFSCYSRKRHWSALTYRLPEGSVQF